MSAAAKYRKFGFFMVVDSAVLESWPASFFGTPPPWISNSARDADSWVAAGISQAMLNSFDDAAMTRIRSFSKSPAVYDVWGRGNVALQEFVLSCPIPRSVLVQLGREFETLAHVSPEVLAAQ